MRVRGKIAGISKAIQGFDGQKETSVDFPGSSLRDFILHISWGMDTKTRELFLLGPGGISPDLVTIVNGIVVSGSDRFNLRLKEGDRIELVSSPG